jgi:hypothetical protein
MSILARGYCFVILAVAALIAAPLALAAPHVSKSYYVYSSGTSWAKTSGCADGTTDLNNGYHIRLTVLDFGGQRSVGGSRTKNSVDLTVADIENAAETYAYNYWLCTGSNTTAVDDLAMGTNNSLDQISSSGGTTWANIVKTIANSTLGQEATSQVDYWGGNDIEAWYADTTNTAVENWLSGWDATTTRPMVNYGGLDGCSSTGYTSGYGYTCSTSTPTGINSHFTQFDYWYLSNGEGTDAVPLPEIYYSGNADQWTQICKYGAAGYATGRPYPLTFEGPLSEYDLNSATLTPSSAYTDLVTNDLDNTSDGCAQTPTFNGEIYNGGT